MVGKITFPNLPKRLFHFHLENLLFEKLPNNIEIN